MLFNVDICLTFQPMFSYIAREKRILCKKINGSGSRSATLAAILLIHSLAFPSRGSAALFSLSTICTTTRSCDVMLLQSVRQKKSEPAFSIRLFAACFFSSNSL